MKPLHKKVRTILGYQRRPRYHKRKGKSAEWQVAVERPAKPWAKKGPA